MLSLSLVTLGLAAVGAYAKPVVRATASLEISLSTPADKVASTSELRVVAIVKNVGDEDLKVIKSGTVLDDEHPTRSFIVTKDGNQVPFTGVEVCTYSPLLPLPNLLRCPLTDIHNYGSHRHRFPRMIPLRMIGWSSRSAGM